jgi:MFS family permease
VAAELDSRRAWMVAGGAAAAYAVSFGVLYTFGAFFDAMSAEFGTSSSRTALVFSFTLLLFFGFGAVSGPLGDRLGPRTMVVIGAVLFGTGLVATSRVQSLTLGYVTYSLGVGLGSGFFVTPIMAAVGGWFSRHRAAAMGVSATGSGVGTVVLAPAAERLIAASSWRDAYLVLAVVGTVVLAGVALVTARPPIPAAPPAWQTLRAVVPTPAFQRLWIAGLLMSVGLYVAFGFVVSFAREDGISSPAAALLISFIGGSSIVGRLGLSAVARRFGSVRTYQFALGAQPIAYLVWLFAGGRYAALVLFAVILGVSYGGFVAIGPEVCAHLFGPSRLGAVLGVVFLGSGIGGLIGPVTAGALRDASGGHALPIIAAIGVTVVATALLAGVPRHPVVAPTGPVPSPVRG